MTPAVDTWEAEVELAFATFATEGEAAFRVDLERLGFTADEIDRFVALEKATQHSTDPDWPSKCRRAMR